MIQLPPPSGNPAADTAEIDLALAQASAGDWVQAEHGTYLRTTPMPTLPGVQVVGRGRGATAIQLAPGSNCDLVQTTGFASLVGTGSSGGSGGFGFRDLTLDQNGANQSSGYVARLYGYAHEIDGVDFINGRDGGVWSEHAGLAAGEARWRHYSIRDYIGGQSGPVYGLYWNGPHDSHHSDVIVSTLKAAHGGTETVYGLSQGPRDMGGHWADVHVWGRNHYCIFPGLSGGMSFTGCEAEGAFIANYVMQTRTTWTGGKIYGTNGNGGTQPNEVGIQVGDPTASKGCSDAVVTGVWMNAFTDPGRPVSFANDWGPNIIQAVINAPVSAQYSGKPSANSEILLLGYPAKFIQRAV